MCHSIVLCPTCNKCPKCCLKSACRGQTSNLLANLAGSGCRPESSSNSERGLHPPLSSPAETHKVSHGQKLLCQSPQEQLPAGGIASAYKQKRSGAVTKPNLSGVLQSAIFGPKAQQQVETYIRSEQTESFPQGGKIQNGDTGNYRDMPPTRGVGHVNRLQGRLLPHTNTGTVQEISEISCPRSDIPVQSLAFWSVDSTLGVHCSSEGGKTDGHTQGYKNPPVPRQLVGESYIPPGLSPAHPRSSINLSRTRLASEFGQIGTGTKASFRFCRLPVRPQGRSGPTDTGPVTQPSGQNTGDIVSTDLSSPAIHVPDRFTNSHRKASSPRATAYKTYTVASQKQLEDTGVTRKGYSNSQVPGPSLTMVARRRHRPTITLNKTCAANLYRRIKRRVGHTLKRMHSKRGLVTTRKQVAYKLSGTKSSLPSLERVSRHLCRTNRLVAADNTTVVSYINKEGGMRSGSSMCPSVEDLNLVYQEPSNSQSPSHPWLAECDSRQAIQTGTDHSDRVVPPSRSFPSHMQQVAPAPNRFVCHEVQQQAASIYVTSTGSPGLSSGCTHSTMGGSGCICLPTNSHLGQSGGEITGHPMQENHSYCSRVAQHALVLGLGT